MTDVLRTVRGHLGRLTLNRPKALNALTHDMVRALHAALDDWEHDDTVRTVLVDGAGDRGLCAGGDIRSIHDDARAGGTASLDFWADEYRLNARIARYPKPYVALMDGVVMGGGVGISAHGRHRVVTERSRIAMPEVGIGFIPDVGGTYLLSRAPGQLGTHLALTGAPVSAADALHCGLADHHVPSDRLADLTEALTQAPAAEAIQAHATPAPASALAADAGWIDHCYTAGTVTDILRRLRDHGGPAAEAAATLDTKSPTALAVTLRALRSAATLPDLEAVLRQEYRTSRAALRSADLVEGVRAQIIDKDRSPRWSPATLAEVDEATVAAYFTADDSDEARLEGVWSR
ncbi:enoyl-CoA hydratase/isomerase family protein [Actinoalloteichus caeruleus]|uniref:enoyl-CoA hydratase/isomerase family protein n=1 Tax=Actinoalloteichus cyanogriseus TaxID=2893586 RepID=UPI000555C0FF|nr:enoyl-CoA hydratase/isomerase family protein [Actinoalloteichus caeruleus]